MQGMEVDKSKVKAVNNWPLPQTLKQLMGFLGLARYYRRFIQYYTQTPAPLIDMLQKDSFTWSTGITDAVDNLKKELTSTPIQALPNFLNPFDVETDASGRGNGGNVIPRPTPNDFLQ